ncbi:hypothetical protein Zm00014a_009479 [Zea mays]|uniref:Uncharacterized protein n=1 Tax=Zea mays TaxID=4577 RepID=A0A3L6FA93_MAIZE|nr:hypothetical protein Zm00014a_009479 [Zea mays]
MTLDAHYLRGSMAAIYSLLKHASCPESLFFHFMLATQLMEDCVTSPDVKYVLRAMGCAASLPHMGRAQCLTCYLVELSVEVGSYVNTNDVFKEPNDVFKEPGSNKRLRSGSNDMHVPTSKASREN